jgi:hypothetical protein
MQRLSVSRLSGVVLVLALAAGAIAISNAQNGARLRPARLLLTLPDYAVTPDGMAVAPDGDLVLACPNFASYAKGATGPAVPACVTKIGKDLKVRKWFDAPVLAETGRSCPMGIEFGPAGELYMVDNQNWAAGNGAHGEINQGRLLRLRIENDRLVETTVIAKGISHPNGVRYRNGQVYVTVSMLPLVHRADGLLTSAVYRFPADGRDIQVANTLADANLLASFVTENRYSQYGLDGIVFDRAGNLYVGNFGDGKILKLSFDGAGNVSGNTVFARTTHDSSLDPAAPDFLRKAYAAVMRTTDGMCLGPHGEIYVADFSNNAIARVSPSGAVVTWAQNPDTGGRNGDLNQPGEPIVWRGRLVVSNFDAVVGPDKVTQKHVAPATLSVLPLD